MTHLVADDATDGTIVHGIVGSGVEERWLQDGCREADLVGRGVIVGIDGLRCHEPLHLVYGFVYLAVQCIQQLELRDDAQVLVERQTVVHLKAAVVLPLVGIADLDDEVRELVLGLCLGLSTHPGCTVNALCEGCLQVVYKIQHTLLARLGEIFLDIELSDGFTHDTTDERYGTLPAGTVLLHAADHTVQLEGFGTELIAQLARGS